MRRAKVGVDEDGKKGYGGFDESVSGPTRGDGGAVGVKIIGITGPTGAGKTTALHALTDLGAHIVDADAVYHALLEESVPLRAALMDRFGDICNGAGGIDRKKLGNVVFADPAALADLNAITHRFVGEAIDGQLQAAGLAGRPAAIDAIALIESGLGQRCDALVGVIAPAEIRVGRIVAREGISEEYARKRVNAQKGEDFFRAHCDYILENDEDDTPEAFGARARALFTTILNSN